MRLITLTLLILLCVPGAWGTNYFCDSSKTGVNTYSCTDTTNAATSLDSLMSNEYTPNMAAGDTIFVRSSHAEAIGTISVGSDGTIAAPIVVWGDDGTKYTGGNGPWPNSTLDATPPTLTCNANYMYFASDDYWHIHNLVFTAIDAYGILASSSEHTYITSCTFSEFSGTSDMGVYILEDAATVSDCVFVDSTPGQGYGVRAGNGAQMHINKCTFDGLSRAVSAISGTINDYYSQYGSDVANAADMLCQSGNIYAYGSTTNPVTNNSLVIAYSNVSAIYRSYLDASKRTVAYYERGVTSSTTDYTITNAGGADYSMKVGQTAAVIQQTFPKVVEYSVYADSAETRSYTIAAYRDANWGTAPTATELYLEATYWSADTLATKVSTATLTNSATWYDLTVADVTPNHAGPVMLTLWLKDYDDDGFIYIDPKLEATGEDYNPTYHWGVPSIAFNYVEPAAGNGQIWIWN